MNQRYMDCPDSQQIVEDMEMLYAEVCMSIPDDEMENIGIEITAHQYCSICELLMAILCTYEGYGEYEEVPPCDLEVTFH